MAEQAMSSQRYLNGYVSVPEAASLIGVSPTTMRALLDRGEIPYTRPSKHRRVRRGDVLAFMEQMKENGTPELAEVGEDLLRD